MILLWKCCLNHVSHHSLDVNELASKETQRKSGANGVNAWRFSENMDQCSGETHTESLSRYGPGGNTQNYILLSGSSAYPR